ncbi:hypothetical protein NP493_1461g00026 [Ridgeia piscesae]|uniref:Uncharacterized protein n=1 Tax=Ridgeia piscesae TaxID=27915 RepID=A0AAD9K3U9_RIDPI|nr:hypothetical protein NP493_1461g00026 [Ridgeia piscesae]
MQGMCSRYACVSLMCVFSLDRLNVASLKLEDVKFNILNVGSEGPQAPSFADVFNYNWKAPAGETYECSKGWKARGVTCDRVYKEPLSWLDANVVCINSGGQLAKIEDLHTNIYIGSEVHIADSSIEHYWIGFTREGATDVGHWSDGTETDTVIGHWMTDQPDDMSGHCVKVNNDTDHLHLWSMHLCSDKLPFVCQRLACLQGEFTCSNGRCINGAWRHDGEDDCGDLSDEIGKLDSCLFHIQDMPGEISSTSHPSNYDPLAHCLWIIEGPVGQRLQLTWTAFDTEENFDTVDIYVGGSTLATSDYVTSLSGHIDSDKLPTYVSVNNFIIVRFTSDKTVNKGGFKATITTDYTCKMGELPSFGRRDDPSPLTSWTGQTAAQCKALCLSSTDCDAFTFVNEDNTCIAHRKIVAPKKAICCSYWVKTCPGVQGEGREQTIPGAGGSFKASTELSYVTSPFYPLKYFSHNKLAWVISAPKYSIITIERLDLDLGPGDTVTIYDGDRPTDLELAKYTGDGSDGHRHITTTGAAIYIYLDAVSLEAGRGFQFSYVIGRSWLTLQG